VDREHAAPFNVRQPDEPVERGPRKADELGLTPRARIVDQTTVGVDPVLMLTGPIPATRKILDRTA